MELNDLMLADGDDARKEAEKKTDRSKTNYVKLKDGEQIRGYLLTTRFVMYMNHGDYNKGIKSHTCKDPKHGKDCLSCQNGVKRTKKTIVPFFNIDTKRVEIFDASNKAMKGIYKFTDEYEEESLTTPISLSRSGEDTSTTYTILPVRVKAAEKELFQLPENLPVLDGEFYLGILNPPEDDYIRELLGLTAEAGIEPVGDQGQLDIKDDDLPF